MDFDFSEFQFCSNLTLGLIWNLSFGMKAVGKKKVKIKILIFPKTATNCSAFTGKVLLLIFTELLRFAYFLKTNS